MPNPTFLERESLPEVIGPGAYRTASGLTVRIEAYERVLSPNSPRTIGWIQTVTSHEATIWGYWKGHKLVDYLFRVKGGVGQKSDWSELDIFNPTEPSVIRAQIDIVKESARKRFLDIGLKPENLT